MTFQRISAAAEIISRYCAFSNNVVAIISFDLLHEIRSKCVKSMWATAEGEEYFMGCQVVMSKKNNYLAVAYINKDGSLRDVVEITDEVADGK